jgi:RND family efflux transporter MFP subunit
MSNLIKALLTVGVLFTAVVMAYGLVLTAPTPMQVEPEEVSTAVRVQTVEKHPVQLKVRSQGNVLPLTESDLIPEVSGRVEWISPNLIAGGYFEKDELLLKLDDRDYQSSLIRSKAGLARAEAEDEHARFELQRLEELVKKKLTSQSTLETAIRSQRIASAALNESKAALSQAERDLWRTQIRAPYNGLVRMKDIDQGQFVQRGAMVAQVYSADTVEIRLPIADRQLAYLDLPLGFQGEIAAEKQANVRLSTRYGGEAFSWNGKLVRTEAAIDSRTRMVFAVVRVQNSASNPLTQQGSEESSEQPVLPVGLFVNAEINGKIVDDIVVLPRAVIRNQTQVLVVDAENKLRFRDVELLRYDKDEVFIQSGLKSGEFVNLSPLQTVIDGMRVTPTKSIENEA